MFGNTSTWGQQNNQQQGQQQQQGQGQQQGGGLFGGGTGGFGQNTSGFGQNTGGFGQPAQQNTGGGLFGGGGTAINTGFGGSSGFGSALPQQQQNNAFGARPAFGATGSTFGATNTGGGGLFGSTNTNTNTFGTPSNNATGGLFGKPVTTSTFGSGTTSNLFGAKPASPFGSSTTASNGVNAYSNGPFPQVPTTGTANPQYQPTWQQDPSAGTTNVVSAPPHLFHVVSAMDPYKGASWDELRLMDYQGGRKDAGSAPTAGFGQSPAAGFGQPAAPNTFGQPAATTSTFGAPPPAGGLFGSTAGTGGFGSNAGGFGSTSTSAKPGGLFGAPQQNTSNPFGGQTSSATGGLFGQPAQAQPATGGGLFGNTNPFGSNPAQPQQQATSTFGGFGANKPAFASSTTNTFGQPNSGTSTTFGQPTGAGSNVFGFGQNQQTQQPQPAAGGLFGGGGFGSTNNSGTGSSLFGQNNQQQQQNPPATGGLFGNTATKPGGLFGNISNTSTNTGGIFGGFGQNNANQPANGGLFGNANNPNNSTGSSLFGQTQQQQQPGQQAGATGGLFSNTSGSSLFGAKPATGTTGGLFGSQPAQQSGQTGSSLFANTGQTGGLFGSTNNSMGQQNQQEQAKPKGGLLGGGSLFGQQNQQQPQQTGASGGMFGNLGQSQPASTSLFANQMQQPAQQQSSLFGGLNQSAAQNQQVLPSLTASLDQNPYGRNELFTYSGQKLDYGSTSKKPALPPLTSSSFRITPSSKNQITKLRGFASPLTSSQSALRSSSPLNGLGSPGRSTFATSPSTDRYKGLTDSALTPNAFVLRPSIKRLTVTPKGSNVNGADRLESVLGKSALKTSTSASQPTPERAVSPGTLIFNPPHGANRVVDSPPRRATPQESSLRMSGSERQPKRGEYWCRPKLEKLKQMGRNDLRDLHNFTAGRRGYGEVTFLDAVNLTGLDLQDLLGTVILFDEMELAVYPDDYRDKPERGHGLNVPAQISLENCFSKDKATKQPITDQSDPRYGRFVKRVKTIPQTDFVSLTDDGVWTFKVEHFSKYGIAESDEESDASPDDARKESKSRSPSESSDDDILPPTKGLRDFEDEKMEEHDSGLDEEEDLYKDEESDSDVPSPDPENLDPRAPSPDWDQPLKTKIGPEGMRKLREMQSSFFGGKRSVKADELPRKRPLETGAYFHEAEEEDVKLDDRAVKRASFGESPTSPPELRQPRKYAKVAVGESIVSGGDGVRADGGLALGRSFRCSWGPNGELVHLGKIGSPVTASEPSSKATVIIEDVSLLAEDPDVENVKAERLLKLHLERSFLDSPDGIPTATLDSAIRFSDFAKLFDGGDRSHEANIWRLGVALFDDIDLRLPFDASEDLVQRISEIRRKLALSKWLENAVAPSVEHDLLATSENCPAKVFTLLSGNQVDRAVQSALDGNDMRLATLIAQAGGPDIFREEVMRQLEDWQKYKANPLIAVEYRRLYALLAGITDMSPGDASHGSDSCPDVLVSDGLDWKRAFGLRLWYGDAFDSTTGYVLDSYDSALVSAHAPAPPLPPYLEKPPDLSRSWNMSNPSKDVLHGLMHLYSDITVSLDQVLRSRDCSPSPLDLRLPWHLYMLLSRVLAKRDFEDRDEGYSANANQVTSGYAMQLEKSGRWKWAVFVLLHLETTDGREAALKALLLRHPDPSAEERSFLDKLQVPAGWLHEAQAADLAAAGDAFGEFHALLRAGLYNRAHRLLTSGFVSEAVLRGDYSLVRRLCEPLEEHHPDGWEYGGKLFLDYINIVEEAPLLLKSVVQAGNHPDFREASLLTDLARSVTPVLQLLPALFPDKEDVQQIASLGDMLSELHHVAGPLHQAGFIPRPHVSPLMVDVDRLHLLQAAAFDSFNHSLSTITASA